MAAVLSEHFDEADRAYLLAAAASISGPSEQERRLETSVDSEARNQRWEAWVTRMGKRSRERAWSETQCILAGRALFLARGEAAEDDYSRDLLFENPISIALWEKAELNAWARQGRRAAAPRL